MLIKKIYIEGVRNLESPTKLEFHKDINVFIGANGSGKSSLLESIYVLALSRSFRTIKLDNIIKFNSNYMAISGVYTNKQFKQIIKINTFKEKNTEKINKIGGAVASNSEIVVLTPTQLVNDETSDLVFKGPELRRKFIDWLVFYASKNYQLLWREFNRILQQRNQILKKFQKSKNPDLIQFLTTLDEAFVKISDKVAITRKNIWEKFEQVWRQVTIDLGLNLLTDLEIKLFKGWEHDLTEELIKHQNLDYKFGHTQIGPHKADLKFIINNKSIAKEVLSRGQGKLLSLTMILARSKFIKEIQMDPDLVSVLLIDDLSAELDDANVNRIIQQLCSLREYLQIFITGNDFNRLARVLPSEDFKLFKVEDGKIRS